MVDCPDNGPYPWERKDLKPLTEALPMGWMDCKCSGRIYGYWSAEHQAVVYDIDKHREETGCEC